MIDRREILDIAHALSLRPQIVEKDYVLGWVLAGIYQHKELANTWIFKGGTSLKKCYFETYRFSEDLDFTLTTPPHFDCNGLTTAFHNISDWIYDHTGIELPKELQEFEALQNPRGTTSYQGKLSYRGPIAPRSGTLPRLKLDLTTDELLVMMPVERTIFHDYSDVPDDGISVQCYTYEEAFAEKVRALGQRARPRDLYDVISLYRNIDARPKPANLLEILKRKCAHRALPVPMLETLEPNRDDLEGSWKQVLSHQLQALPPLESFWNTLSEFFDWLRKGTIHPTLTPYSMASGEFLLRDRTLHLRVNNSIQSYLETIRFAASNLLCVDLAYNGTIRRIEPYSLRRTQSGNIVLHAERLPDGVHRSYRVDRIQGAAVSDQSFVPRYRVELRPKDAPLILQRTTERKVSRRLR